MKSFKLSVALCAWKALQFANAAFSATGPFPNSYGVFSSAFQQPSIPKISGEWRANWMQHKWDIRVSHISSGFWYNSASQGKVRVDEAYDGSLASSLFDYTNTTHDGGVSNRVWTISPSVGSTPQCFSEYVTAPAFPLMTANTLQTYNATFGGVLRDPYVGFVQSWNLIYGGTIPVIVYLDVNNFVLGYDFWGEVRRTKVVTRFFNVIQGDIDKDVFENFPC